MNILRQDLAPVSKEAWEEIKEQARIVFSNTLTARKYVDVDGPRGWGTGGISLGRLDIPQGQGKKGVQYGIHQFMPLVESRCSFKLDIWELDNAVRGAEDIDLGPLEEAAGKMAAFEEKAVYQGFPKGKIQGLLQVSENDPITYPREKKDISEAVAEAVTVLKKNAVGGPYQLVLGVEKWKHLTALSRGYPVIKHLKEMTGSDIIINPIIGDALLVSRRGGDFELVIGQDLSIGYEFHSSREAQLYLTESFTFRVLDPAAVVVFK